MGGGKRKRGRERGREGGREIMRGWRYMDASGERKREGLGKG